MLNLDTQIKENLNSEEVQTIFLYEVEYDTGLFLYFASWDVDVTYQGKVYQATAIKHSEISQEADGKISDLNLTVGNADRLIQFYIVNYDLLGKYVTVKQIFPASGSNGCISTRFKIKSVYAKKDHAVFTLSLGLDFLKLKVPSRIMMRDYCLWRFKDSNCAYSGPETSCKGTFDACREKSNTHNFGGFPAILNNRLYF